MFAQQHELKFLNFGLILYIALGTLLFYSIGDFDHQHQVVTKQPLVNLEQLNSNEDSNADRPTATAQVKSKRHKALHELRMNSVRRMWNITNQLNILYESNWTQLILAELIKFETKFVHSLESSAADAASDGDGASDESPPAGSSPSDEHDDDEDDEARRSKKDKEDKSRDEEKKSISDQKQQQPQQEKSKRRQNSRLKSIKKALVHSIATVTTMSSPIKLSADEDPAASGFIKLATIFYGSIGIPLLVLTVAKSGHQLAYSSLNSLIVVRHYCFSLPAHYLCCSCNLFSCLKTVLSWCCCCCCCFSFLRCLLRNHSRPRSPTAAKKSRPDKRPRLRLLRHRPPEGATESTKSTPAADNELALQQSRSPYVIGFNVDPDQRTEREKAVRFVGSSQNYPPTCDQRQQLQPIEAVALDGDDELDETEFYSFGVVLTSAILLVGYLLAGAHYYSKAQDITLVEALFACYSMLSGSKLPDSFDLDSPQSNRKNPLELYEKLVNKQQQSELKSSHRKATSDTNSLVRDSVYLLIGLNLVSTCAHFAKLWLDGKEKRRLNELRRSKQTEGKHSPDGDGQMPNGFGGNNNSARLGGDTQSPFGGSLGHQHHQANHDQQFNSGGQIPMNDLDNSSSSFAAPPTSSQYQPSGATNQLSFNQTQIGHQQQQAMFAGGNLHHQNPSGQYLPTEVADCLDLGEQQQQHIDLTELYVVNEIGGDQQQQQLIGIKPILQHHSDGSFTSDRSSETRSLCLRHQAQMQQQQQQQQPTAVPNSYSSLSRPGGGQQLKQSSFAHEIGLIGRSGDVIGLHGNLTNGGDQNGADTRDERDEEEEDEEEMNRMLTNCLQTTKFALNNGQHTQSNGKLQLSSSASRLADHCLAQQQQFVEPNRTETNLDSSRQHKRQSKADLYGTLDNNNNNVATNHHHQQHLAAPSINEDRHQTARRQQQKGQLLNNNNNSNNYSQTTTNECDSSPNTIDNSHTIDSNNSIGSSRIITSKFPVSAITNQQRQQEHKYNSIDRQNGQLNHRYRHVHSNDQLA